MQAVFDGSDGRRLTLDCLGGGATDLTYVASLSTEAGECSVAVWEYNSGLAVFMRDIANDWRGFDGERAYASTEGHLSLTCRHDGRGTVHCRVVIGRLSPPEWSMAAGLEFGAGSHLDQIADAVEAFFSK
jgi:hypothetical protein